MREEIARASRAGSPSGDPSGNLEGLLLGRVEGGQNLARPKQEVQIGWFLPLTGSTAEHVSAIEKRIEKAKKRNLDVIGVFRTHINELEDVNTEDLRLANLFLSQTEHILLVIRLDDSMPPSAGMYFPYGRRNASHPAIVFPFDRTALTQGENELPTDGPLSTRAPSASSRLRWFRIPIAIAFIAFSILAYLRFSKPVPVTKLKAPIPNEISRPLRPDFRLTGSSQTGFVRLTWDTHIAAIASAAAGLLTVEDGTFRNIIRLNRSALQEGSVVYHPLTTEVRFKLQVGPSFSELTMATIPAVRNIAPAGVQLGVNAGKVITSPPKATNTGTLPPVQSPQPPVDARVVAVPSAPVSALPPPLDAASASAVTPQLPEITAPIAPPAALVTYVAPDSDRRVFPDMPSNISRLLTSAIVIHVTVQVDAQGIVTGAVPRESGSSIVNYLAQLSKQASLRWHFKPARRDSVNVASQTVLEFRYSPPQ